MSSQETTSAQDRRALEQALLDMAVPDTQTVKAAEAQLKLALRTPACLPPLVHLLRHSPSAHVRQLCAILLRMRVRKHWAKLDRSAASALRAEVLATLVCEEDRLVALNTTHLIAAVSQVEFEAHGGWKELLAFMDEASTRAGFQEVCMMLFSALTETICVYLSGSFRAIVQLYKSVMQQPESPEAFLAAVKAASALVEFMSVGGGEGEEVLECRELVEFLVRSLHVLQNEQVMIHVAQVVGQVATAPVPLINPYVPQAMAALVKVVADRQRSVPARAAAANAAIDILRAKARICVKNALVDPVFSAALALVVEDFEPFGNLVAKQERRYADVNAVEGGDEEEGEEEEDEVVLRATGSDLLGALTTYLPNHTMLGRVTNAFTTLASSAEPKDQWTAATMLLHCTDGLAEELANPDTGKLFMDTLMKAGTSSSAVIVRVSAWMCISEWISCLPLDNLEQRCFIEAALKQLEDSSLAVVASVCDVLDVICENSSFELLEPYVQRIVDRLLGVVNVPCNRSLKATALSALSSLIAASEAQFTPFIGRTFPVFMNLMQTTHKPDLVLRAYATRAMGNLAVCVSAKQSEGGSAAAMQELMPIVSLAVSGLDLDDACLTEATLDCIGNLARAMGHRLDDVLEQLLMVIVERTVGDDGIERCVEDADNAMLPQALREGLGGEACDDDEEDLGEEEDEYVPGVRIKYNVRTATVDTKMAGLAALQKLLIYVGGKPMQPFLEDLSRCGRYAAEYVYYGVRQEGLLLMKEVVLADLALHPLPPLSQEHRASVAKMSLEAHRDIDPDKAWVPGLPAVISPSASTMQWLEQRFLPVWMDLVELDENKEVVEACLASMEEIVARIGPAALQLHADRIMELLVMLLRSGTTCQQFDSGGDEEDAEEPADHDRLLDAVGDLLGVIAQACGKSFKPYLHVVCTELAPSLEAAKPVFDRVCAMGAFAEIFGGFGASPHLGPYVDGLLPYCLAALQVESLPLQRNAAFLLGTMIELAKPAREVCIQALDALAPLLQGSKHVEATGRANEPQPVAVLDAQAVVDNACGAVGRILLLCPHKQAFAQLLDALPLRFDMNENLAVYHAVSHMYAELKTNSEIAPYVPRIINVVVKALQAEEQSSHEARGFMLQIVRAVGIDFGQQLPPEQLMMLQKLCSRS